MTRPSSQLPCTAKVYPYLVKAYTHACVLASRRQAAFVPTRQVLTCSHTMRSSLRQPAGVPLFAGKGGFGHAPCGRMGAVGEQQAYEGQQRRWMSCWPGVGGGEGVVALVIALVLGLSLQAGPALASDIIVGTPRVVDGDTLDFEGKRVRLFGVDAPESKQTCTKQSAAYQCGSESAASLQKLVGQNKVTCQPKNTDLYGRTVAACSAVVDGRQVDLGGEMVRAGQAVAYRQYSQEYVEAENNAKDNKRGIWAGTFTTPSQYRQEANQASLQSKVPTVGQLQPSANCKIKGNINSTGDRIYHVPGGRFYEVTQISPEEGERYFCTEKEAQAAGWRRSAQ